MAILFLAYVAYHGTMYVALVVGAGTPVISAIHIKIRREDAMAEVLEKVSLLQQFQQDRRSGQDREIIGIVLGQLLYHPMTNPAYVSLVLDDVARKWHEYLDRLEVLIESAAGQENVELMTCVVDERLATPPDKQSALPHFVDEYVFELEEHDDWPDDERARLWFAHAKRLAPGPSDPQQQGRPVWTRPRSMRR